jgi:hypothetical protein
VSRIFQDILIRRLRAFTAFIKDLGEKALIVNHLTKEGN